MLQNPEHQNAINRLEALGFSKAEVDSTDWTCLDFLDGLDALVVVFSYRDNRRCRIDISVVLHVVLVYSTKATKVYREVNYENQTYCIIVRYSIMTIYCINLYHTHDLCCLQRREGLHSLLGLRYEGWAGRG